MSSWRKLPACGKKCDRKLEAYATYSSNGAKDAAHSNSLAPVFRREDWGGLMKKGDWLRK
jgi:hypothetical protein